MPVKVMIPTPLRPYTENKDSVEVEGQTIDEILSNLALKYPQLKRHLFSEDGRLRNFVNVYVNEEDIRYLDGGDTKIKEGDVVSIIPAIAGGNFQEKIF
ncbi:ubiquitin-like small modifier protein 1 [Candidatus Chrysopegis kryptomonas]|uniref:Molybdopterin synthase subunit MoaD n=1 Tax=Candidatus Chryseopegocella kryptomonas TaxID=1633643 RepID=A0A0P1NZN1_9BACT|nr:ubiquitin-like small modifier protein 1 [Candidatus Chrysopegis kryptomonas]CUT05233.1 molybdopterin synthase subunit MoaD [Candidatus Chrysopegis kryptomonas]